jgi:hypothetical protein
VYSNKTKLNLLTLTISDPDIKDQYDQQRLKNHKELALPGMICCGLTVVYTFVYYLVF